MSKTPLTDAATFLHDRCNGVDRIVGERYIEVVPADLAAELEAGVVRLTEDLAKWRGCAKKLAVRMDVPRLRCTLSYEDAKALIEFDRLVAEESKRIK